MGSPFSDITLYTQIPHSVGTPEYWEETSLQNFVSDLYVQKMYRYKPPKASRVTIQTAYHNIWKKTWKIGSIISIAGYYSYDDFKVLNKKGKYHYILDLIQNSMLKLSEEYKWDRTVFEKAYKEVIESDFKFKIDYPVKKSRDKKKAAKLSIEKTETKTSVYADISANGSTHKVKLFDKENMWWYDCVYKLSQYNKWFDKDRFGISYGKGMIDIWYSIDQNEVATFENGNTVKEIDFKKFFRFG